MKIAVILFNGFQDLDVFGPAAVLASVPSHELSYHSLEGGMVKGSCGALIDTRSMKEIPDGDIVLVPGGFGTRAEVNNAAFVDALAEVCRNASYVLTVCTGAALLARTGLLDGRRATSNKRAFEWAVSQGPNVTWEKKARWVVDGNIYTSSGVTAGIDMALGFIADRYGLDAAKKIAEGIEHLWNADDDEDDPFSV